MVRLAVSVVASRQVSPAPRGHTTLIQLQTHCLGSSLATGQHISPRLKLCAAPRVRQQYSGVSCAVFYDSSSTTYQVPGYSCCIIVLFIRAMVVLVEYHGITVLVLLCSQTLALVSRNVMLLHRAAVEDASARVTMKSGSTSMGSLSPCH